MSVNSDMAESLRREKARNLRYKKAFHADLNLASIGSKLMEMYESASDVLYWCENDGESTQLDELIGDEEETYELRMAFSTLEGDCQQMLDDLDNEWVPEFFDDFFGGISPRGSKPTAKTVIVVTDYSVSIPLSTIPEFTYTGDYEIVNDSDEPITISEGNWKIRFLTSGTLTFTNLNGAEGGIDVFLVGGGGNGETIRGARGGGGGYTKTVKGVSIAIATPYTVTIGASSGTSSAFGASANGASGANGGSGGGGGGSSSGTPGNGGSNGGNGTAGNVSGGGTGQGTTTREFGESTGKLYSGGGGGSAAHAGAAGDSTAGAGAAFGGAAKNGVANTGGGGGAAYSGTAGAGGSGIVIIRNVRGAA